jgi:hypothetical protein
MLMAHYRASARAHAPLAPASANPVVDLRAQYRIARSGLVSAGIDNRSAARWAFHPSPQRTYTP